VQAGALVERGRACRVLADDAVLVVARVLVVVIGGADEAAVIAGVVVPL